jgi:hypothetical protein
MARGAAIFGDRFAEVAIFGDRFAEVAIFCDRFSDMGAAAAPLGARAEVCKCQKCQKKP